MALFRFIDLNAIKFDFEDKELPFITIDTNRIIELSYNYKPVCYADGLNYHRFIEEIYGFNNLTDDIVNIKRMDGKFEEIRIVCSLTTMDSDVTYRLLPHDYIKLSQLLHDDIHASYECNYNDMDNKGIIYKIDINEYVKRKCESLKALERYENQACYRIINDLIDDVRHKNPECKYSTDEEIIDCITLGEKNRKELALEVFDLLEKSTAPIPRIDADSKLREKYDISSYGYLNRRNGIKRKEEE